MAVTTGEYCNLVRLELGHHYIDILWVLAIPPCGSRPHLVCLSVFPSSMVLVCLVYHFPLIPTTRGPHYRPLHSRMFRANRTTSSPPNFQLIFNNALESYKKRTKNDLLAHPLSTQLQDCASSSDVLALIHQQVQGLQKDNDRLTKWLDPTVRVLHAFSETLGEGVSLVCIRK